MASNYRAILNPLSKELQSLGVLYRWNPSVGNNFCLSKVRNSSYYDYWSSFYRENWYDFQMKDLSLLSFNKDASGGNTFIYLGCPFSCPFTEEDFYSKDDLLFSEVQYEDYIFSSPKYDNVPYLRYDNSIKQYKSGLHPANHFHFGYNQNNRIGCSYHIDVASFVAIVLRQFYPDAWEQVLKNSKRYPILFNIKKKLNPIETIYYNDFDKHQDYYLK